MADLPTNLKDDILDSSVNTRRKYRMIENEDGTVEFEDVTKYSQIGDEYGSGLINETNKQVNAKVEKAVIVRDLETIGAITREGYVPDALALKDVNNSLGGLQFGVDENGNYGYIKAGADTVTPFKKGKEYQSPINISGKNTKTYIMEYASEYDTLFIIYSGYYSPRKITISTSNDGVIYTDLYTNISFGDIGTILSTDNDNNYSILLNESFSGKYIRFVVNSGNYSQAGTANVVLI